MTVESVKIEQVEKIFSRSVWVDAQEEGRYIVYVCHDDGGVSGEFPYAEVNIDERYMTKKDSQLLAARIAIDIGAKGSVKFFGDVEHIEGNLVAPSINHCCIESDIMGSKHITISVDGQDEPFTACKLNYAYQYTSNANMKSHSELVAKHIGYEDEVELGHRSAW